VILNDPGGPWTAAAYLVDDAAFAGEQHGVDEQLNTLCGLAAERIVVVRNPFWGTQQRDCPLCASRLRELAALARVSPGD
jgi:hypothetical protein